MKLVIKEPLHIAERRVEKRIVTYLIRAWHEYVGDQLQERFSFEHWLLALIALLSTVIFVTVEYQCLKWFGRPQSGINGWVLAVVAGLIWIGAAFEWHLHDTVLHDHHGILHDHPALHGIEKAATISHEQHHGGTRLEIVGETDDAFIVLDLYQYTRHKQLEHGTFGWHAVPLFQGIFGVFAIGPVAALFPHIGAIYAGNATVAAFYICYETFHYYKHVVSSLVWPSASSILGRVRLFSRGLHHLHHLRTELSQNVVIPLEDLRRHTCIGLIAPPEVIRDENGRATKRFLIKKDHIRDFRFWGTVLWLTTGNASRLKPYRMGS